MQFTQDLLAPAAMAAGAAMVVAPVIVAGPALAVAGFGAGGIAAGRSWYSYYLAYANSS